MLGKSRCIEEPANKCVFDENRSCKGTFILKNNQFEVKQANTVSTLEKQNISGRGQTLA
jgi:hypothetical protein